MNNRRPFDDPFFDDFNRTTKKGAAGFAGVGCLMVLLNLAIICGVIYFIFWCLQHFGVI